MSDKLTTEILAEVKMIQQMIITGHYTPGPSLRANEVERGNLPDQTPQVEEPAKTPANLYLHLAIFWLTSNWPFSVEDIYPVAIQRQNCTQQQWQRIALAFIALEIDQRKHEPGIGIVLIVEERQRQMVRGYTTARDLSLYRFKDDLLQFAIYRLTDNKQFYPWDRPYWLNENQKHDETERIIQAGAILLAHDCMKLAAGQHSSKATKGTENPPLKEGVVADRGSQEANGWDGAGFRKEASC